MRLSSLALVVMCGCASNQAGSTAVAASCQPRAVRQCASIDAQAVGQLPLELRVGSQQVSVAEWTMVDERSNQVIGFAAHVPGEVTYTVHAGGEDFSGRGARWLHPAGLVGRHLHAIDGITFCATEQVACVPSVAPALALR
jgi:Na+-transporting NADH:ubiquinone oxidoreductase subunit NqrA